MKICLFLQRRFTYIGHELALLLKERHGVSEFCAYVSVRAGYNFLKQQNDIAYSSLLLDDDVHNEYLEEKIDLEYLRSLEKEYGIPNLWPYLEIDRVIRHGQLLREYPFDQAPYTHEEMLRILQVTARRVITFLEKEKPDYILFSVIGSIASLLLHTIAKKKGIRILNLLSARVHSQHLISDHYALFGGIDSVEPTADDRARAREYLTSFREKPAPYTLIDTAREKPLNRAQHLKFLSPRGFVSSITFACKEWLSFWSSPARYDYSTIAPWHRSWDAARRKLRILIGYDDLYDAFDPHEDFAYYPLHMEPEIVTMLYAPTYSDQTWVIKQIARALPVGYILYVKEHLAMFGYRTRAFYKELKKIPNVKLVRPTISSFDIMPHAKLITTLTGTVGWEALLLKKPVVTFGDIFYNALSGATECDNIKDLPRLVQERIASSKHDENELVEFIAKIFHESVHLDLVNVWERERGSHVKERREELVPLVDLIYKKMAH
jgi:hypothetical protein